MSEHGSGCVCTPCNVQRRAQEIDSLRSQLSTLTRERDEARAEAARLRAALEEALQILDGQSQRPSRIARMREALAGEGEVHQTAEGGKCRTTCRTVTQRVNSDWCIECRREMERRAETETLPFCACGRRVSDCDGSRKGCGKTPEKARQA